MDSCDSEFCEQNVENEICEKNVENEICEKNVENVENKDTEQNVENKDTEQNVENKDTEQNEENDQSNNNNNKNTFEKNMSDLLEDLLNTFPELEKKINSINKLDKEKLKKYCSKIYPERFFDILYENNDIFEYDYENNVAFLPGIDFKTIWNDEGITNNTKKIIWKYLQLILFSIIGSMENASSFGDTAKLFEAINEDTFKDKLEDTLKNISEVFENKNNSEDEDDNKDMPDFTNNMPNSENLHEHLSGMLNGKIGQLASEIAEDVSKDFNLDGNEESMDQVFKSLLKNPKKIMGLVKNISSKLDTKIKSGELKESELMSEASEMLNKMKDMPGMGNIGKMFGDMGIPGVSKKTKININAMKSQLERTVKSAKIKENITKNTEERKRKEQLNSIIEKETEAKQEIYEKEYSEEAMEELYKMIGNSEIENKVSKNKNKNKKKKKKNKK